MVLMSCHLEREFYMDLFFFYSTYVGFCHSVHQYRLNWLKNLVWVLSEKKANKTGRNVCSWLFKKKKKMNNNNIISLGCISSLPGSNFSGSTSSNLLIV